MLRSIEIFINYESSFRSQGGVVNNINGFVAPSVYSLRWLTYIHHRSKPVRPTPSHGPNWLAELCFSRDSCRSRLQSTESRPRTCFSVVQSRGLQLELTDLHLPAKHSAVCLKCLNFKRLSSSEGMARYVTLCSLNDGRLLSDTHLDSETPYQAPYPGCPRR